MIEIINWLLGDRGGYQPTDNSVDEPPSNPPNRKSAAMPPPPREYIITHRFEMDEKVNNNKNND